MKKTTICSILFLVITMLTACYHIPNSSSKPIQGYEIAFPDALTYTISNATEKTYDAALLQEKLSDDKIYLYADPVLTDYKIVTKFGFGKEDYVVPESAIGYRFYGNANNSLEIDKYGCFTYSPDTENTAFDFPFSDEETVEKAKQYLIQNNLWIDGLDTWSIDNTISQSGDTKTVIARCVRFYRQLDGIELCGNEMISVELNGNGEVTFLNYNIRQYRSKQEAELISIEEAIQRIEPGKAYINIASSSRKLIFEDVSIVYWAQNLNLENAVLQPAYAFQGTSINADGEEESFTVTVQANRINTETKN